MKTATAPLPPLRSVKVLDQLRERIRYLHYSLRTEQAYVHWVRAFIRFHGVRHPATLGSSEVEAFLSWLANERKVSVSTHRQALAALLFFYGKVLCTDLPWLQEIGRPRPSRRLPVVLTPDEVLRLPVDEALVILRGHKILKVHKMDYSLHPAYKQLRECKASAHIPEWRKALPETSEVPPAETSKSSPKAPPKRRGRPAKSKAVVAIDKESIITKPENEKEISHGNEQ